jgi:hypothetical protein
MKFDTGGLLWKSVKKNSNVVENIKIIGHFS